MERLKNRPSFVFKAIEWSIDNELCVAVSNVGGKPAYVTQFAFFDEYKSSLTARCHIGIVNPGASIAHKLEKGQLFPTKVINVRIWYKNVEDYQINKHREHLL